jgi:hypothetical protein
MRCRQHLDIAINAALLPPPKQLHCFALPFFVWEWGRGGKLFGKARSVFFLKMELIQLYVHRVKQFSIIHFLGPKQVTVEC